MRGTCTNSVQVSLTSWASCPDLRAHLILAGTDDPLIPVATPHPPSNWRGSELTLYQGGHLGLVSEADELLP
jgi:hypothetical protein